MCVFQIERIQNLTLYKQYEALKRQIEDAMPNTKHCERKHLWHGTKPEAVDGINKYGFNRSYSDLASEFLSSCALKKKNYLKVTVSAQVLKT